MRLLLAVLILSLASCHSKTPATAKVQLYWFIPDGFRADPITMKIYDWADQGVLPNIKWMMDHGAYGYSVPTFPGHTPVNTATLVTGAPPSVHGVADLNMRAEGTALNQVAVNGFSSLAKKVPPIWYTLENLGRKVALLSMPGSTPPEIYKGIIVRGRWGDWGLEFPAIVFQTASEGERARDTLAPGGGFLGKYVELKPSSKWGMKLPPSLSPAQEVELSNFGATLYGYIYASAQAGTYDHLLLSTDKQTLLADLKPGEWSGWKPMRLLAHNSTEALEIATNFRLIQLGKKGALRLRVFYDNLNSYLVVPTELNAKIHEKVGPMVDFVDNFPPQLIQVPEDQQAFLEEARMSTDWHKKLVPFIMNETGSEIVLHNIYTPNQMLTSRWWLPYVDPKSSKYHDITEDQRKVLWKQVQDMYRQIDSILGAVIANADENTYIALSSDHGAIPLDKEIMVNNILFKNGLLKFTQAEGHYREIDWKNSQAVFLQMTHVFINPDGLAGPYHIAHGPRYEALRTKVQNILKDVKNEAGENVFAQIITREEASKLDLPTERVGDLILAYHAGYLGTEQITGDLADLKSTLKGGYKQGVLSSENGMLTPFMIAGPKVKKGFKLSAPIQHQDQYPTLMKLLGYESPAFVRGHVVKELLR